jgi:hypothetical protein
MRPDDPKDALVFGKRFSLTGSLDGARRSVVPIEVEACRHKADLVVVIQGMGGVMRRMRVGRRVGVPEGLSECCCQRIVPC